jgi:succinate---hydroxymethylglutarate CoA-transferase
MNSSSRVFWRSAIARPAQKRPVSGFEVRRGTQWVQQRMLSTESKVDKEIIEKLPLAGIRVLDMTRVLAGVSIARVVCYVRLKK